MSLQKLIEKMKCDDRECGKASTEDLLKLCEAAETYHKFLLEFSSYKGRDILLKQVDARIVLNKADQTCKE